MSPGIPATGHSFEIKKLGTLRQRLSDQDGICPAGCQRFVLPSKVLDWAPWAMPLPEYMFWSSEDTHAEILSFFASTRWEV